jgi:hypothetical protein
LREIFDKNVVTNVLARVPPSSKVQASQPTVNIEDVDGSGCEGEDDTHVTPWAELHMRCMVHMHHGENIFSTDYVKEMAVCTRLAQYKCTRDDDFTLKSS